VTHSRCPPVGGGLDDDRKNLMSDKDKHDAKDKKAKK